jgi:Notch-like protein
VVSNVRSPQRTDGSKKVDIWYDLSHADESYVSVVATDDGRATRDATVSSVSGTGAGISPGVNKHIVWDSAVDLPGAFGSQYTVRVCAGDSPTPPCMVCVPGGSFDMGDTFGEGTSDELPVHSVYLSPYYIDKYEVTNEQYAAALNWAYAQGGLITVTSGVVYKYGSGNNTPYCDTNSADAASRIHWDGGTFSVTLGKEDHPVLEVSWYGSVAFSNWRSAMEGKPLCYDLSTWTCNFGVAGYRLPTEAEWEKAAGWDPAQQRHFRFGEHTDGCGYNCLDGQRANYWSSDDPYETGAYPWPTPVGYYDGTNHGGYQTQIAQSYYGCYDMSGNGWEWCHDRYSNTYYSSSPGSNPTGPATGSSLVLRGGGWNKFPNLSRSAARDAHSPGGREFYMGFRCAAGADCSTPTCTGVNGCSGHGTCIAPDTCQCESGWEGADCSTFNCTDVNDCSANGTCIGANTCQCNTGWIGMDCTTPTCPGVNDCSGKGTCIAPDTCECESGWEGADCSSFNCSGVNNCSANGTCIGANTCDCNKSPAGADCSVVIPAVSEWGLAVMVLLLAIAATAIITNRDSQLFVDFPAGEG